MDTPVTLRHELQLQAAKARLADRRLRALGLEDNECGRLADHVERALASYEKITRARARRGKAPR